MANASDDRTPRILVIDDNELFVRTTVASLNNMNVVAEGRHDVARIFEGARNREFNRYDVIFTDMRLGTLDGRIVSAADVLLYVKTYSPQIPILVFTQRDITPEECITCMQRGAIGIIPKGSKAEDFVLIAKVYPHIGDASRMRESFVGELWAHVCHNQERSPKLEMLVINLFNSMTDFPVLANSDTKSNADSELIVENRGAHTFWKSLNSLYLLVECKADESVGEENIFNAMAERIKRKAMCNAGIVVSLEGVSSRFRALQSGRASDAPAIYYLDRSHMDSLVRAKPEDRAEALRAMIAPQL